MARLDDHAGEIGAECLDEPACGDRHVRPAALRVSVRTDRDWFDIAGKLKVEHGRIKLAVRLDVAHRQRRYVRMGRGGGPRCQTNCA